MIAASDGNSAFSANNFASATTVKLCAYTGSDMGTPCGAENPIPGANADTTVLLTLASGQMMTATTVSFIPGGALIPGPETNTLCVDDTDDDGDGKVNDGCPPVVFAESGAQCDDNTDQDGDTKINDGCPSLGSLPLGAVRQARG